ncbi:hypothetical protein [Thauera sp. 2A1]|uniref:hypothetical protein n=1 Tax=Thauera sp. 2A1 TaxID=2570191 RepID=UPI001D17C7FD|nr:hypothetical protein [Thauera sp. 2A1]KAI5915171.1 hypothetical protein GH664_08400 [Thauera sp. 2A1]
MLVLSADFAALDAAGLNLQAVLDLADLPPQVVADLRRDFAPAHACRQIILIGNAGRAMWTALRAAGVESDDPIDDFSVRTVMQWFAAQFPGHCCTLLYPGDKPLGLQTLGRLAGWHQPTPFKLGILPQWGSWFGYRAALLTDTDLAPTAPLQMASPCASCAGRPCIAACPAQAMADGEFVLDKCARYRLQPDSRCRTACVARDACPVGREHRYDEEQVRHSYSVSLRAIEQYCRPA